MRILFLVLLILLTYCSVFSQSNLIEMKDWEKHYKSTNVHGTFILYDLNKDEYLVYNPKRIDSTFIPASTFKIFNSLTALETRVIKDEYEIIKWDSVKRFVPEWNQDLNMKEAMKYSAVWFYQELARRIGQDTMQHYIDLIKYGNQNINGGIDLFWLSGDLRITPKEQIDFLVRLYKNDLPFSQRTLNIVNDILIFEKTDKYTLRAKTGWGARLNPQVGWFVGYVENGGNVYFFANNIDIRNDEDNKARIGITKSILQEIGLVE